MESGSSARPYTGELGGAIGQTRAQRRLRPGHVSGIAPGKSPIGSRASLLEMIKTVATKTIFY